MRRILILGLFSVLVLSGQRRRIPGLSGANGGAYNLPPVTFRGELKEITSKQIFIEGEDGQTVTIYRNHKTRFLLDQKTVDPKKIAVGSRLTLDVAKNPDGTLLAVNVMADK